ncbi:MAG TPA: response regulator [Thermoanaerobaculia bacterium]|nr:response regulator [Thermoanaerobaculia bacterium]HUM29573.1 response regulator [Thermoanaerobaculia bacterium]HXK67956.1 response regulator [Thermoanaerobaculia bacterium]
MAKILVADDSKEFLSLYRDLITSMGVTVITAENGAEAIQRTWSEKPDLVILDLEMPEMTGAECTRLLKQDPSCTSIPVIIVTSHIGQKDMAACYQSGVEEILAKPFSNAQIENLLRRHLSMPS